MTGAAIPHETTAKGLPRLSDYDYELPEDRIAQTPIHPRDHSKLLAVTRNGTDLQHRRFYDLPEILRPNDLLVVNETRVSAVRLFGTRAGGGRVEALLLRTVGDADTATWDALVRPGARVRDGDMLKFEQAGLSAAVVARTDAGGRILHFATLRAGDSVMDLLEAHGRVPLPPYITTPLAEKERYQTVYARTPGSAAAPTAGLHFTPELLDAIAGMGIQTARVRLDVGLGTFRPIKGDIADHEMHAETFEVTPEAARAVNQCTGRVVAVGTTSVRALETAALSARVEERVAAVSGETRLFVQPGYDFRAVDALITNFHQPHSTLLLLVAAFAGGDTMRRAYQAALENDYRFLSFGDALFIA